MADEHLSHRTAPDAPDAPAAVATGTASYYLDRLADFRRRNPATSPPSYYADYGDKCLGQFLSTRPTLSPRGRSWVDDTLELLQEEMEQERRRDDLGFARMERDDDAFRKFAFSTHAPAYQDAGVFELGVADLWKIARTPDLSDLLNDQGLREIVRFVFGRDGPADPPDHGALSHLSRSNRWLRTLIGRSRRPGAERPSGLPATDRTD